MDDSELPTNTFPTQRDASPDTITDLFAHFTIGAPATRDVGKSRQLNNQKPKPNQRLPTAAKRRLLSSDAATQPSTRTMLATDSKARLTSPIEAPYQPLLTEKGFTFKSSKTIDFSKPNPPFPRSTAVNSEFISQPSFSPRVIKSIPSDILVPIIRFTDPDHLKVLKSLSLVNKAFHYAVAPILYKNLCLPSLSQAYDFSFGLRHPLCVVSLRMFLTPDPKRPEWLPPDPRWTNLFLNTLFSLERLVSLGIKRCGNDAIAKAILSQSNNPKFLPSLQSLSFGVSHQFAALSLGRPIRSCGFTFQIKEAQDCDKLKGLLTAITSLGEQLRELYLVINTPAVLSRSRVLKTIGECAPGLHRLSVRFQLKGHAPTIRFYSKSIARLMPPLNELTSLELFDTARFDGEMKSHISAAKVLTKPEGPCPNLRLVNFDGTLWKRTSSKTSSPIVIPTIATQADGGGSPKGSKRTFPKLSWTPYPASRRGCKWWGSQAHLLEVESKHQKMPLLRQWVLQYWNPEDMWEKVLEAAST